MTYYGGIAPKQYPDTEPFIEGLADIVEPPPPSPPPSPPAQGMRRPPEEDLPDPDEIEEPPPHYDWLMASRIVDAYPGQQQVDESMARRLMLLMDNWFGEDGENDDDYGREIQDVFGRWLTCFSLSPDQLTWALSQPFVFPDDIELPDSMQTRLNSGENITIDELFSVLRI